MKNKKPYEEINVSAKHLPLRIAAFAIAVVIAAGSIGYGVSQLGRKDPGWYTVNAAASDEALSYSTGIRFEYYMDGSSDTIKAALRLLEEQYSDALLNAYMETDPVNTYPGIGNIASLNGGEKIKASPALYEILKDAYTKTLEKTGYNMFAGAFYGEWNEILFSNDPTSFDPEVNTDEKERLNAIENTVNELSNFTLSFDDAELTVELKVSDDYLKEMERLEISAGPIDLNLLRDAYMLRSVRNYLESEDWHRGYFATESGLGVYFSEFDGGTLEIFGRDALHNGEAETIGTLEVIAGESLSTFRAYALADIEGYYSVNGILRSPYFTASGSFGLPITMAITADKSGDPVEAVYYNIKMFESGVAEKSKFNVLYTEEDGIVLKIAE